jgi:hypothetical protein
MSRISRRTATRRQDEANGGMGTVRISGLAALSYPDEGGLSGSVLTLMFS